MERRQKPLLPSPQCIASLPHRRPDVTPAPLGTGAAHLVIERVEVLGAIHRRAVEAHRLLARFPCCALLLESNRPLGRALRGPRLRDALPLPLGSIRLPPATFLLVPCAALRAGATGPRIGCLAAFARRRSRRTSGLSPIQGRRRVPQITLCGGRWWIFSPNYLRLASPNRGKYLHCKLSSIRPYKRTISQAHRLCA